jgi:hypothetical protein
MRLHELKDFKLRKALPESNLHKMKVKSFTFLMNIFKTET